MVNSIKRRERLVTGMNYGEFFLIPKFLKGFFSETKFTVFPAGKFKNIVMSFTSSSHLLLAFLIYSGRSYNVIHLIDGFEAMT